MSSQTLLSGVGARAALTIGTLLGTLLAYQPLRAQTPFANYNLFAPPRIVEGPLSPEYGLPSLTDSPLPGWDANAVLTVAVGPIPPPALDSSTLILTIPINDTSTHIARDNQGNELGQLALLATGSQKLDLNADNAVVDEGAGTIQVNVGTNVMGYQPVTFSVLNATGMYASDIRVLEEGLAGYAGGSFLLPLDEDLNTSLQDNILSAWQAGQVVGADLGGVLVGNYVPEPSSLLEGLIGSISTMDLPNGVSTALGTKLDKSLKLWESENHQLEAPIHKLEQFIHFVDNHDGTKITPSDADFLVDSANEIIGAMHVINEGPGGKRSSSTLVVPEPSGVVVVVFGFAGICLWRSAGRPL